MAPSYTEILNSKIYTFAVGPNKKTFSIHGEALAGLSKPLDTLLNGPHQEAQELHVNWPEVDEEIFVRFIEWAYAKTYVTEDPTIFLDHSDIPSFDGVVKVQSTTPVVQEGVPGFEDIVEVGDTTAVVQDEVPSWEDAEPQEASTGEDNEAPAVKVAEAAAPSLMSVHVQAGSPSLTDSWDRQYCHNPACQDTKKAFKNSLTSVKCLTCREDYRTMQCNRCTSAYSNCPKCTKHGVSTPKFQSCANTSCSRFGKARKTPKPDYATKQCPRCCQAFYGQVCGVCGSALSDCPYCSLVMREAGPSPRARLIARFLDSNGDHYPASVPAFVPRQNTESCEDYSGVFMCHAKLYVVGDIYDIPELCQLSLHRLHATLSCFELFPGRCDDIAVVAKYLLANTREDDKIREMMALFYACQAEHVCNNDTFRSLLAEEPDFAAQVFSYVVGRL